MLVSGWVRAIFIFSIKNIEKTKFQVGSGGFGWIRVGSGGFGWVRVVSGGFGLVRVVSGGFEA